jgi:hypothetical protein
MSLFFSNLRNMFEGIATHPPTHLVFLPVLWGLAAALAATILLKIRFNREWQLTLWTAYRIQRVWQRLSDESSRTGGTITSHFMGILTWGIAGGIYAIAQFESGLPDSNSIWHGLGDGCLFGIGTLVIRSLGAGLGGWMTLEYAAVQRGLEIDRHMRNWLLWIVTLLVFLFVVKNQGYQEEIAPFQSLCIIWWIWLILKWCRQLQIVFRSGLHFGWGIAYICTLEIGPSLILYWEILKA